MMTEFEICQSYRLARNRKTQVHVLSELTLLPKKEILEILARNGEIRDCDRRVQLPPEFHEGMREIKRTRGYSMRLMAEAVFGRYNDQERFTVRGIVEGYRHSLNLEQLHKVEAAFGMTKAEIEELGRKAGDAKGA